METTNSGDLKSCQCEMDSDAIDKPLPEHEKAGESRTESSIAQAEDHDVVPGPGETDLMTQTAMSDVSVSGTVEKDPVDHEVGSEMCTEEMTPNLNEVMETCLSEQTGDQSSETTIGVVAKDLTGHGVVPESRTAEISPERNEQMEMSASGQNRDEHPDTEKKTIEKGAVSPLLGDGGSLALLSMQYRDESSDELSESESDSSSSTSSSSSSSSSDPKIMVMNEFEQDEEVDKVGPGRKTVPVRTQDELLIEDLPAVENLTINLPEDTAMEPVGIISSIVDQLVIIESKKDTPPLKEDSVLFSKNRTSIGRVFEVFGPVCQPYYILRFNSQEDIEQRDLRIKEAVYFAPSIKDFTEYIFVEQIKEIKGSDASWKNDQEPPPEALDFSDDEQERIAKQKLKAQRRPQQRQEESDSADSESSARRPPPPPPRRKPRQNRSTTRGRPTNHEHRGGFHTNYHANPHFQQDSMQHPPDPYRPPFLGRGYPPYPQAPPPHVGIDPWFHYPYPGPVFYPPPPPPPPPSI